VDGVIAAVVNLNHRPYYIHWGVIQLSAANAIVIVLMIVVFAAAVAVPFPGDADTSATDAGRPENETPA